MACSGAATAPVGDVSAVTVSPSADTITVGANAALVATVMGPAGTPITGQAVFWSSENPAVATVSSSGQVTGVGQGAVRIAASAGGKSGIAAVTVLPAPVATVTVSPKVDTVTAGSQTRLVATPRDAQGNLLIGRAITWSTNQPGVATVDSLGIVTGVARGTATILATSEGKTGSATVVVLPPPAASVSVTPATANLGRSGTVQLSAVARDSSGAAIDGAPIAWSSGNDGVATVSTTGLVTAVAPGVVQIFATSGKARGSAQISVSVFPMSSLAGDGAGR